MRTARTREKMGPGSARWRGQRRRSMAALVVGCALLAGPVASALPAYAVPQKSGTNTPAPDEPGAIPKGLESFYSQEVSWYPCGDTGGIQKTDEQGKFSCATVTVPMDYSQPDGKTIQVAVKKRAADGEPRGSLFINPGGPGGSGIGLVEAVGKSFSKDLLAGYDVVGFDPRGVGSSTPITCQDAKPAEEASAEHPQEESSFENWAQGYMDEVSKLEKQCREHSEPGLLDHVNTVSVAKDLDVLRAVSGEKSLNYLGFSYGTELGYTYAELFPEHVGRMVLDGAVDSTVSHVEFGQEGIEGYEKALRSYVQACLDGQTGDCPLAGDVEEGVQQIRALIASADASPMKTSDPEAKVTGAQLAQIIQIPFLQSGYWQQLTAALTPAITQNDASGFAEVIKQQMGWFKPSNAATLLAVLCQDRPSQGNMEAWKAQYEQTQELSPTFGARATNYDMTCAAWGHYSASNPIPQDVHAEGAPPILVVGATGDPATPYHWSEALAEQLDSGHLLTWEGNAHGAYGHEDAGYCLTTAVDGFLLGGQLPQNNLTCTS